MHKPQCKRCKTILCNPESKKSGLCRKCYNELVQEVLEKQREIARRQLEIA